MAYPDKTEMQLNALKRAGETIRDLRESYRNPITRKDGHNLRKKEVNKLMKWLREQLDDSNLEYGQIVFKALYVVPEGAPHRISVPSLMHEVMLRFNAGDGNEHYVADLCELTVSFCIKLHNERASPVYEEMMWSCLEVIFETLLNPSCATSDWVYPLASRVFFEVERWVGANIFKDQCIEKPFACLIGNFKKHYSPPVRPDEPHRPASQPPSQSPMPAPLPRL